MRKLCQLVPALLVTFGLAGCYDAHGRPGGCEPPRGQICCNLGTATETTPIGCACPSGSEWTSPDRCTRRPLPDGGLMPPVGDGGLMPPPPPPPWDAGPSSCEPMAAYASCFATDEIPADSPFAFTARLDTCGCCPTGECRVGVESGTRTLRLETYFCHDLCDCIACSEAHVTCEVPGLRVGEWEVLVNGEPAYSLTVVGGGGLAPPSPSCVTHGGWGGSCPGGSALPPRPYTPNRVCFEAEHGRLAVENSCGSACAIAGPCTVRYEERITDDLPAGGELYLEATEIDVSCGDPCPDVCEYRRTECALPDLEPGLYRVWADGVEVHHFYSHHGASSCNDDP